MTTVRELITVLGFELDETNLKKAEKGFQTLKGLAAGVAGAVTGAGIALFGLVKATANAGDNIRDTARALGITVEELQELRFAGEQSGVSNELLANSLKFLQKNAYEAAQGSKDALENFADLGVKATVANGKVKPTVQLFLEVADALAGMTNESKRTNLGLAVMGRGAFQMLPLMLEGAKGIEAMRKEARDLGFILNKDATDMSDELNDSLHRLQMGLVGVGRRIAVQLMPMVLALVGDMTAWLKANRKLIDEGIKDLVSWIKTLVEVGLGFAKLIRDHTVLIGILLTVALLPLISAYAKLTLTSLKAIGAIYDLGKAFWALKAAQALDIGKDLGMLAGILRIPGGAKAAIQVIASMAKATFFLRSAQLLMGASRTWGWVSMVGAKLGGLVGSMRGAIMALTMGKGAFLETGKLALEYIKTLGLVAAAQVRAGVTALVMYARILALPIAIAAAIAMFALFLEDLYVFSAGGKSAIGAIYDAFVKDPLPKNANWMVRAIRDVVDEMTLFIDFARVFFKKFFDEAAELGGIGAALNAVFSTAIAYWWDQLLGFFKGLGSKIGGLVQESLTDPLRNAFRPVFDLYRAGSDLADFFGTSPATAPVPALAGGAGARSNAITVGGAKVDVHIAGDASPAEVQKAAKSGVDDANRQAADEIASRFPWEF